MDEQKAVEYLDSLKKRAFMTMNEVDLANLVLKYKNELSKEKEKNRKAIEWIDEHIETYTKNGISIIDWNTTSDPRQLKDILRGEK